MGKGARGVNITEIIPDDLPQWAIEAMAEGRFFSEAMKRIDEKWTSVDDWLPEEEGVYLCHFSDGTIETFHYQSEDQRNLLWGVGTDWVTHWMPLPRPPTIRSDL